MDEQKAIQQLKNGDIGGLEILVAFHQVKAVRTAYLITQDFGLAEDIVQDSFIQAFRAMPGFDATRPNRGFCAVWLMHPSRRCRDQPGKFISGKNPTRQF